MKDRAIRRHHKLRTKRNITKNLNSCIQELSPFERQGIEGNIEKIKKACIAPVSADHDRKLGKKTIQERKHDITMREQFQ